MAKKERLGSDPLSFIKDTRSAEPECGSGPAEPSVENAVQDQPAPETEVKTGAKPEEKKQTQASEKKDDRKKEAGQKKEKSSEKKGEEKKIKSENLTINIKGAGSDSVSLFFNGEMTIYNVRDIKNSLIESLESGSELSLDLSKVNNIDTAGFQMIVAARNEASESGKKVSLLNPAGEVKKIFELYGEEI